MAREETDSLSYQNPDPVTASAQAASNGASLSVVLTNEDCKGRIVRDTSSSSDSGLTRFAGSSTLPLPVVAVGSPILSSVLLANNHADVPADTTVEETTAKEVLPQNSCFLPEPQQSQLQQQVQQPPQCNVGNSSSSGSTGSQEGEYNLPSVTAAVAAAMTAAAQHQQVQQRQQAELLLLQAARAHVSSSRDSPLMSTTSTPPLPQLQANVTSPYGMCGGSPRNNYVEKKLKDMSAPAETGSSSHQSAAGCMRGGNTALHYVETTAALSSDEAAVGSSNTSSMPRFGNKGSPALSGTDALMRADLGSNAAAAVVAAAAAAADGRMEALQRFVESSCYILCGGTTEQQPVMSAGRDPAATAGCADERNSTNREAVAGVGDGQRQLFLKDHMRRQAESQLGKKGGEGFASGEAASGTLHQNTDTEAPCSMIRPNRAMSGSNADNMLLETRGASLSFEELLSQVHKLLRSNSNSSFASSGSTPPCFPAGHLPTASAATGSRVAQERVLAGNTWENLPATRENGGCIWGKSADDLRAAVSTALHGLDRHNLKKDDGYFSPDMSAAPASIDFAVLQAVANSITPLKSGLESASPGVEAFSQSSLNAGPQQGGAGHLDVQAKLMVPDLHRGAGQARIWDSLPDTTPQSEYLQNTLALLKESQRHQQQQQQQHLERKQPAFSRMQQSPTSDRLGSPQSMYNSRSPMHRAASGRLLPPAYQGSDQIQSAPNPSTPIIRGNDKIPVEQYLLSFPFTLTADYQHAVLKFCADHNLVVKLLGYHGKRVELLERQYCCRIQTSAQASSFPGYPNGRCILFTGPLTSLLRACSDLYAVVDTSSPGLRTNIEGYRVCLVVPGDFVGRLLRNNCAGLHALQEMGGRAVHIALGNLCVVMRNNYSERVLLIDGNLEGVCHVLESTATQLQDFLRRYPNTQQLHGICGGGSSSNCPGGSPGGSQSLAARYEFLDYPKRIELHLST